MTAAQMTPGQMTDLPAEHNGPYLIIEVTNQMLVKSLLQYETFERALGGFSISLVRRGNCRLIQEADLRWYMDIANTNYRSWWQGDDFVAPSNWNDSSQFPRKHN